jgi:hypothetical protein
MLDLAHFLVYTLTTRSRDSKTLPEPALSV